MASPTDVPAHPDDPTDPRAMTAGQRLDELCALLARGVRRALVAGGTDMITSDADMITSAGAEVRTSDAAQAEESSPEWT